MMRFRPLGVWLAVGFVTLGGCQTAGTRGQEREAAVDAEVSHPKPPKKPPATPSSEPRPEFQQESPKSQ